MDAAEQAVRKKRRRKPGPKRKYRREEDRPVKVGVSFEAEVWRAVEVEALLRGVSRSKVVNLWLRERARS